MSGRLERLEFRAVGTTCAAAVTAGPRARRALAAARDEVSACEAALSRFDPASDLSRLNASAGAWTRVDRRLVEALRLALRAREDTGGLFDPTVLPALAAAGYDRSFEQLVERAPRRAAGWRAGALIELDEEAGCARLEPGAAVDLGGIGKGYAAMRAVDAMRDVWPTLPGALVDLGGDLALHGAAPGRRPVARCRHRPASPRCDRRNAAARFVRRGDLRARRQALRAGRVAAPFDRSRDG